MEKTTVNVNLAQGIDQSASEVLPRNDSFSSLQNAEFDKIGRLNKRRGVKEDSMTGAGALDAHGSVVAPDAVISNNKLLVKKGSSWEEKHKFTKAEFETFAEIQITNRVLYFDTAEINNHLVAIYVVRNEDKRALEARYSVVSPDKKVVIDDVLIESEVTNVYENLRGQVDGVLCSILKFQNVTYFYYELGLGLSKRKVVLNTSTFSVGTPSNSNVEGPYRVYNFAACGERAITRDGRLIDSNFTVTHVFPNYIFNHESYYSPVLDRLFMVLKQDVVISIPNTKPTIIRTYQILSNSVTLIQSYDVGITNQTFRWFGYPMPTFFEQGYSFLERLPQGVFIENYNGTVSFVTSLQNYQNTYRFNFNANGHINTETLKFANYSTILPIIIKNATEQKQYFVSWFRDIFYTANDSKEETSRYLFLHDARTLNVNGVYNTLTRFSDFKCVFNTQLQHIEIKDDNTFIFPAHEFKTFNTDVGPEISSIVFYKFNLNQDQQLPRVEIGAQTLVGSGFLNNFDGDSLFETGFMIQPYAPTFSFTADGGPGYFMYETTPNLFGGPWKSRYLQFPPGWAVKPGSEFTFWFALVPSGTWASFQIRYIVDGAGGVNVNATNVYISRNDTPLEVAMKTINTIGETGSGNDFVFGAFEIYPNGLMLRVYNSNNPNPAPQIINTYTNDVTFLQPGTYSYKYRYVAYDANGVEYRSPFSQTVSTTITGTPRQLIFHARVPYYTNKKFKRVGIEVYRTKANGTIFYKTQLVKTVDSGQPQLMSAQRRKVAGFQGLNDISPGAICGMDALTDAEIALNETSYDTGGILENGVTLTNIKHLCTYKERVLAVSKTDYGTLYVSKPVVRDLDMEFPTELILDFSEKQEATIGVESLEDKFVIFNRNSIIAIAGDGPSNTGVGASFSLPYYVSQTDGATNTFSICKTDDGIFFKSTSGFKFISKSLQIQDIGLPVRDLDHDQIGAAIFCDDGERKFILVLSKDPQKPTLLFDMRYFKWAEFTNVFGFSGIVKNNALYFYRSTNKLATFYDNVFKDDSTGSYNLKFITNWMSLNKLQDFYRVTRCLILGQHKTDHTLQVKSYYNYDMGLSHTYSLTSSQILQGGSGYGANTYQANIHLAKQKIESLKLECELIPSGNNSEQTAQLTDLTFYVGLKQGPFKTNSNKKA